MVAIDYLDESVLDNWDHETALKRQTTYQRNVPIAMFILSVLLTLATIYSLLTGSWYWAAALPFAFCLTAWWTIVMAKFSP